MEYRVYTSVNYADTCRDPDDIHHETIGYKRKLEDAIALANAFIKTHFFHKDTKLIHVNNNGEIYFATDCCSYGKTVIIEEIEID